jgi:DNA-binding transcriptional ArsR family regulator
MVTVTTRLLKGQALRRAAKPVDHRENVLDALGNPTRRAIVRALALGPKPVGEIAQKLPVSRPAVSKHLRRLESAGLVCHESRGTRNVFRLNRPGFESARAWLDSFWQQGLARFALVAENSGRRRRTDE